MLSCAHGATVIITRIIERQISITFSFTKRETNRLFLIYCNFPQKTTSASVQRPHFLEILNSPDAPLVSGRCEDWQPNRLHILDICNTFSYRHRNSASILTVEIQAIFQWLEAISLRSSPSHTFFIISDSLCALTTISNVHSPHLLAIRIHTLLITLSAVFQFITFI